MRLASYALIMFNFLAVSASAEQANNDNTVQIQSFKLVRNTEITFQASFVFKNTNDFKVKDLKVRCDHSGPSGTKIDSNTRTIYRVISARGELRVPNFDMGFIHSQASNTNCWVIAFSSAD